MPRAAMSLAAGEGKGGPFASPHSWVWVPFGQIMISRDGERIPVSKEERNRREKVYDYYGASGVIDKIDGYLFDKPLLLIGEDGANLINRSTPIAFIARGKYWVNNHAHVLDGISEDFLRYIELFINSIDLKPFVTGTAQPKMNQAKMNSIPVALPPENEQRRILTKVDELMALCDRLEAAQAERESWRDRLVAASLHRLNQPADPPDFRKHARFHLRHLPRFATRPEHVQQLRQTILNLAVRGKLVPQDVSDEPASSLYERLQSALVQNGGSGRLRARREILPTASAFFGSDVFPPSWVVTNFDSVNAIVSGVAKGKDLRGVKTAKYPYLRVANVQRGYLDLSVVKELEIRADEFARYRLCKGDVLMTEGGDWDKLGRTAIWNEEVPDCIHQNHIYRIRPANREDLLSEWVALFANSLLGRSYFESASKQTTNLASINMTQLRSCPLPLPPRVEQHRIVAKVDELMAVCDRLEAQLATAQSESRRLLEAVLHEALAQAPEPVPFACGHAAWAAADGVRVSFRPRHRQEAVLQPGEKRCSGARRGCTDTTTAGIWLVRCWAMLSGVAMLPTVLAPPK